MPEEKNCKSCLSDRFRITARGLCKRCYPLVRKLKITEQWDLENPQALRYYPKDQIFNVPERFKKIKSGTIAQIKERLSGLRMNEQIMIGRINGADIVPRFQGLAKLAGSRSKDFLWHAEDLFDHNFSPKQKKILFKILNDITESIPWRGISYNKIFNS